MDFSIDQLALLTQGQLQKHHSIQIHELFFDSRNSFQGAHSLFIALKTAHGDGHFYLSTLYEKGCRNFLVSAPTELPDDCNIIEVQDSLGALQLAARSHRQRLKKPILAIIGSLGKTTVKEWLYLLLANKLKLYKSPKSYNSQLGVALSILSATDESQLSLIEAGISRPDEMSKLENIIQPDWVLITNIAPPHQANFSSEAQKLSEKIKMCQHAKRLFYSSTQPQVKYLIEKEFGTKEKFSWGHEASDDLQILQVNPQEAELKYGATIFKLQGKSGTKYHFENAMHCLVLGLSLGLEAQGLADDISRLPALDMRLEMKQGIENMLLINDSYSADFDSLRVALSYLERMSGSQAHGMILSDFEDMGIKPQAYKTELTKLITQFSLEKLILIGPKLQGLQSKFSTVDCQAFADTASYLSNADPVFFRDFAVLVKGARKYGLEQVIQHFQEKSHRTQLEINLTALSHNYTFFKQKLKPSTKIMVLLKAMAYGAGSFEIARWLQKLDVDYLAVAYIDEGVSLRQKGIFTPIMVLNPELDGFHNLIRHQLEPEIYSLELLDELISHLDKSDKTTQLSIHLNIDTGMHRLGFSPKEIPQLIERIQDNPHLKIASVFTHLAASESQKDDDFTQLQLDLLDASVAQLKDRLKIDFLVHAANSAGILRNKTAKHHMVRLGIGFYGVDSSTMQQSSLAWVFKWKSEVSQIIPISIGETVGYGRQWKADKNTRIATIPLGYADGINRHLGKRNGQLYLQGKGFPIIGQVCMDMLMIDLGNYPCKVGDEVSIFENFDQMNRLCQQLDTIPYEILTSISQRVKRIYLEE